VRGLEDELDADEAEDDGQADRQVDEAVEQPVEQEVQLPQAQQRERVGGEDDVRLLGQAEDRRDGVEREQDVGRADRDHDEQQRRGNALAVDAGDDLGAVVLARGRQDLLHELEQRVVADLRLLVAVTGELDRRVDEEGAEQEEHADEGLDEGRAHRDERASQTSASTMPNSRTLCWCSDGTWKLAMMMTKTNRLSTDSEYSVR
jgi:hypothetical protein